MKIIKLELYNFKRIPFILDNPIVFNFEHKLNLILGINGSGKSTLISELSPLPANKEDFYENGYKKIIIEKDNVIYTLTSTFSKGNSHSFILNDEELNIAGLVTTQKDLVYKYFHLNNDIMDILTSKQLFTDMSLQIRKKLFNNISHINIEKIIEMYNDQKEELKINTHLLKSQTNLLNVEMNKLLNDKHISELQNKISINNDCIKSLLEIRNIINSDLSDENIDIHVDKYLNTKQLIKNLINKFYFLLTSYPYKDLTTIEVYIKSRIESINDKLKDRYSKLETIEKKLKLIDINKNNNKHKLEEEIVSYKKRIDVLTSNLQIVKTYTDTYLQDLNTIYYSLINIINEVPINNNQLYTVSTFNNTIDKKYKLLEEKNSLLQLITNCKIEIDKLEKLSQEENIECPKCNHSWKYLYDKEKHNMFINKTKELENKIEFIDKEIKDIEKYITDYTNYINKYKIYSDIKNEYREKCREVFSYIDSKQYYYLEPKAILRVLTTSIEDVKSLITINELNKSIKQLTDNIILLEQTKNENEKDLTTENIFLNEEIEQLLIDNKNENRKLKDIDIVTKLYKYLNDLESTLQKSKEDIQSSSITYTFNRIIEIIDIELNKYNIDNINIQSKLASHNNINVIIEKYKQDISELQNKINIISAITEELNPKSGIISKIISNYLNSIVFFINKIIINLWSYKMELIPYDIDKDELDYKFKINIEDKFPVKDISLASSGMKEIINLSFRLAVMKLLKLDNYPLHLDEFGVRLDTHHKNSIYTLISKFITDSNYSQIFLITHLDTAYADFKDTNVIRLS